MTPPDLLSGDGPATTGSKVGSDRNAASEYYKMEGGVPPVRDRSDDDDDHNDGMDKSIVSSVLTADGIHDFEGFMVVCLVIFIGDMSRGAMFPSLWPLVHELGGTEVFLGFAVASFSFGRILVNPMFGSWSHTWGYTNTLTFSTSVLLLGTLAYGQVQNVGRKEFLIVAQTILGIGSGTLGVTRAFVADVTAKRSRTTYMAWITAVQYCGFTVTPFVGALFNKVLGDDEWKFGIIRFNMYTAPAYFMSIVILITLVLITIFFQGRVRIEIKKDAKKKSQRRTAIEDYANRLTFIGMTIYDCCIVGCMLLNVSTKGTIATFETMGIRFAESYFDMDPSRAGTIVASCGAMGVMALLSMGYLSQHFSDIQLISGGMVVMMIGIVCLSGIEEAEDNDDWRYFFSIFMLYAVGYPIGHTAVIGLFSKIVGRRPQGTLLGWFASAGSLARILYPIMSGYIAKYLGIVTLFYVVALILLVSTFFVLYSRKILELLSS